MKTSHLSAAVLATVLLLAAVFVAKMYAEQLESRAIHALAPQIFPQKNLGVALQRAAFRQPDLLVMYGSSDLTVRNRYHPSALFRTYPTGFTIFPIGNAGNSSLTWLQALAAVGADLRGKKVVVSVPARSFASDGVDGRAYAATFSRLHASELAFSGHLSFAVKQAAARRLVQYPETLKNDSLLAFALQCLADGSVIDRMLYYASWPLGTLYNAVLRLQDHWETLLFLNAQQGMATVSQQATNFEWTPLLVEAERETQLKASTPFGFENAFWAARGPDIVRQKGMYASVAAVQDPQRNAEWVDFDLMLRVIKDLGGTPLILSRPLNGAYFDYLGVAQSTRRAYYERLRAFAQTHDVLLADFFEHDDDKFFTVDPAAHLSSEGWVHYDRVLDAFFHDRKPGDL